jgi:hypothetical protein
MSIASSDEASVDNNITDYNNFFYTAEFYIGSNSQQVRLQLDTGSSVLWIPSMQNFNSEEYSCFDCTTSTTCDSNYNDDETLYYGKGSAQGYRMTDQVNLGGITIPQFNMLLVDSMNDFSYLQTFGLLGLGLGRNPYTANFQFPTILETLSENGLISTNAFSILLGITQDTTDDETTGEIIFGGYDSQYAQSDFAFVNVYTSASTFFWAADLTSVGYGTSITISDQTNVPCIFDTGTSLLDLPQDYVNNFINEAANQGIIISQDSNSGYYTFPCSEMNSLPNLVFYFGSETFQIPPSSYTIQKDGNLLENGNCALGINSMNSNPISLTNPIILGDVFLKNFYTYYNADDNTVGFTLPKPALPNTNPNSNPNPNPNPNPTSSPPWIMIILVIVIVVAVVVIYERSKAKKQQDSKSAALISAQTEARKNSELEMSREERRV